MDLHVCLEPQSGSDPEALDRLGRQLRNELRSLDVEVVQDPPAATPGADEADALTEWQVSMSAEAVFPTVVATIEDWLGRRAAGHKVTLTVEGDTVELDGAAAAERAEVADTFIRRHQPT